MKNFIAFIAIIATVTGCCFSQIPTQYVYVDEQCSATLPDYTSIVTVRDNCAVAGITQSPDPGLIISANTPVTLTAADMAGNETSMTFDVVLLDTIPPTMQLDSAWAYTDEEVGDMYRTFYGHTQLKWNEYNGQLPIPVDLADTLTVYLNDSIRVWTNTIVIPDTVRRDWWWANNFPNLDDVLFDQ